MRLPAEWERQKALLVAYPHEESDWRSYLDEAKAFYDEFIDIASRYQEVLLLVPPNSSIEPRRNVTTIPVQTNDTWIRDYGPITVFDQNTPKLLDFTFNGWGLKFAANHDNLVNRRVFGTKKIGFVLEGGSVDSNGQGILLTTESCLLEANRNPHMTKAKIEHYLKRTFGLQKILWLKNSLLEGDDTDGHIDMLARFVNENTIVYSYCDDPTDIHYDTFQKMQEELKSFGFHTIALPWVSPKYHEGERLPASYANFVIINGAVIVPTYNDPNDTEALKIFQKLFPDRDVLGVDATVLIRQHGSIHCSCMNVF